MIIETNIIFPLLAIAAFISGTIGAYLLGRSTGKTQGATDLGLIKRHLERIQDKRNDQDDDLLFISDLVAAIRQGST